MADVVTLHDGDVLVVHAPHLIDADKPRLAAVAESMAEIFPDNRVVLVRCSDPLDVAAVPPPISLAEARAVQAGEG